MTMEITINSERRVWGEIMCGKKRSNKKVWKSETKTIDTKFISAKGKQLEKRQLPLFDQVLNRSHKKKSKKKNSLAKILEEIRNEKIKINIIEIAS
jgi:hypothetical protein